MRSLLLTLLLLLAASAVQAQPYQRDAREDAFVDSLLALMTVDEKLGQLTQYTGRYTVTGPDVPQGGDDEMRGGRIGSFLNLTGADVTRRIQRIAVEESRLGIPVIFAQDVIHGFRTIFPVPLAETASWNLEGTEQAARIAAREAAAAGVHWTFAPMVDIARDSRWGRIVEGSGEDPYLGSVMAQARVRGFQGTDLSADTTIMATAKHFVAYGGAEAGRDYNTVDMSERTLREVFLPPFEATVDVGVQAFMTGFNEVGGEPVTGSRRFFTEILRDEWGFDGMVVSDYTAVWELIQHGVAADSAEAGLLALNAGVDMSMVDGIYIKKLPPFADTDALPMAVLDEAVRRVLRAKYRVGLFEDPYRYNDTEREAAVLLADEHRAFARQAGREAIVLLKNDNNTLPLSKDLGSLAVIGALADDSLSALGSWAALGRWDETTPILAGLRMALPNADILYEPGYPLTRGSFPDIVEATFDEDRSGHDAAVEAARQAEAVVLVLGEHREISGEAASRTSITLPGSQSELAQRVLAAADGKPVVVVLTNGRALDLSELDATAPAIVEAWYLGTEMGPAVADVLLGDYNPGGKLPITFPRNTGQIPIYYNHKNTGRPPSEQKYTSRFLQTPVTPLYPFGYGLSYTTFSHTAPQLSTARLGMDETLTITTTVTNTGDRTGTEVVQLYVQDEVATVTRPVKELKGFERLTLEPGETRTVTFTLTAPDLRFWGLDNAWTTEPGFFTIFTGASSEDVQTARFELTE
ncbi:MAG: beta-glucosidase BglX [Bacteroidota bacterium]